MNNNWEWKAVQAVYITGADNVLKPNLGFIDYEPTILNKKWLVRWSAPRAEGNFGIDINNSENGFDEKVIIDFSVLTVIDKEWIKKWNRFIQNRPMAIILELYDGSSICIFGVLIQYKFQIGFELGKSSNIKITGVRTKTKILLADNFIEKLELQGHYFEMSYVRITLKKKYDFEYFQIGFSEANKPKIKWFEDNRDIILLPNGNWDIYVRHKNNINLFDKIPLTITKKRR